MNDLYKRKKLLIVIGIGAVLFFFAFLMPGDVYKLTFDDDPRYAAEIRKYGFIGDGSTVKITFNGKKIKSGSFSHPWDESRKPSIGFSVSPYNELYVSVNVTTYSKGFHSEAIGSESETYTVGIGDFSPVRYKIEYGSSYNMKWYLKVIDTKDKKYSVVEEEVKFDTKEEALKAAEKLKQKYKDSNIVTPGGE